jgi:hypothetical protein
VSRLFGADTDLFAAVEARLEAAAEADDDTEQG